MPIFNDLVEGKISLATAAAETMTWLGQCETSIAKDVASDPAVQSAVNTFIADGKAAVTVAGSWADTAISGGLGAFSAEIAVLVTKYAPILAGSVGGPLSAAAVTALQALAQIGVAAVQHEVTTVLVKAGGVPVPGLAPLAASSQNNALPVRPLS